jgi:uncharacterized membrane protein HdeD (DUF308 family)
MTAEAMTFETKQSPWWLILMGGILNLIIGVLLLTVPVKTVLLLVLALGIYWMISGIFTLVGMFVDHTAWGWKLFVGLLGIIAGIVILRNPLMGAIVIPQTIVLLVGIQGLLAGGAMLVMAFQGGGWGAGILGVLSMVFGFVLMFNYWRLGSVVALVWVTAIFALVGGVIQIFQAFRQRSE